MKRSWFLWVIPLLGAATAAYADNGRIVKMRDLPEPAREFVGNLYANTRVETITEEREAGMRTYEVAFADGASVEFDAAGRWMEIDGNRSALSPAVIPAAILGDIYRNFPGRSVVRIERERNGFEVELDNGTELEYNRRYRLINVGR